MLDPSHGIPDTFEFKFSTESGTVTWARAAPREVALTAPATMVLVSFTPQIRREFALDKGSRQIFAAPVGAIEIVPCHSDLFVCWTVYAESLSVEFDPRRLRKISGSEFHNEQFAIRPPKFGTVDQTMLMLAKLLREEFKRSGEGSYFSFDSLITLFGVHLLRTYSSFSSQSRHMIRGGLTPKVWRAIVEYIDANLPEDLSLDSLANVAGLSPSHFLRAFHQTSGEAPHQYVLSRRVARAKHLIKDTDMKLGDVARLCGFSSHSHMTSAMKRILGITPRNLRRDG